MEEIDLFPRKNGRRNTEELILSILQKTRNELKKKWRKRFIRTVLPQKVIVPDAFSHFVKEFIVWSPELL